jgi:hypothetical protein
MQFERTYVRREITSTKSEKSYRFCSSSMGAASASITFFVAPYDLSSSTYDLFLAPMIFRRTPMIFSLLPLILRLPRIFFAEYAQVFAHLRPSDEKSGSIAAKVSFSCPPLIEAHEGGAIAAPPGTVLRQQHTKKGERT